MKGRVHKLMRDVENREIIVIFRPMWSNSVCKLQGADSSSYGRAAMC